MTSRMLEVRVAIAVVGVIVWGYGVARDQQTVRLVGIALLAVSLVLRLARRRRSDQDPSI